MRRLLKFGTPQNPCLFLAKGGGNLTATDRNGDFSLTASGALRYQPANGARINLVRNPRFANDTSGWSVFGAGNTMTRITGDADFGACVEVLGHSAGNGLFQTTTPKTFIAAPGAFTVSFDCKLMSGPTDWKVSVQERDAQGTAIGADTTYAFTAPATATRIKVNHTTVRTGTHQVMIGIYRVTAVSDSTIRVSNIVTEAGTVANPTYFDGSLGGVWLDPITGVLGTAHASPSVSKAAFWIEEGTTNVITNPSFETNTTGWSAFGVGALLTRDTTYALYGSSSVKVTTTGSGTNEGISLPKNVFAASPGQSWSWSVWLRGSGTVYLNLFGVQSDGNTGTVDTYQSSNITLTDQWTRYTLSGLLSDARTTFVVARVTTPITNAVTFWADAAQLEQKSYATSYCDGSLGTGYTWAGTAHASASTRAVTIISAQAATRVNTVNGSVVAMVQRLEGVTGSPRIWEVGSFGAANGDHLDLVFASPYTTVTCSGYTNAGSGGAVRTFGAVQNQADALYGDWTSSAFSVKSTAVSGVATGSRTIAPLGVLQPADTGMRIGSSTSGGQNANSLIGPIAIFARPLTDAELAKVIAAMQDGSLSFTTLKRLA